MLVHVTNLYLTLHGSNNFLHLSLIRDHEFELDLEHAALNSLYQKFVIY